MASTVPLPSFRQDPSLLRGADRLLTSPAQKQLLAFVVKLLLALWKPVVALGTPLGRVLSMYVWALRTGSALGHFTQLQLLKLVGWLYSPAAGRHTRVWRMSRNLLGVNLRRWHVAMATLIGGAMVSSALKRWQESHDEVALERRHLHALMRRALTFKEWTAYADRLQALDVSHPLTRAAPPGATRLYDEKLLSEKTDHLQGVREGGSAKEMMYALRIDLIRNIANVARSQVPGTRAAPPITRYLQEVKDQLHALVNWPEHELSAEEKLSFFKQTRLAYGRTALLLGGGGGLGTFHIGVIKTLFEHRMLPRVLAGSSVGSIVCAMVGTKTDVELKSLLSGLDSLEILLFNNVDTWSMSRHFLHKGSLQDMGFLIKQLRQLLGDATFLEAYERTGRILNITVCPADTNEPPRLLNYCTAPQALIWSAVAASSAFPGLFPAQNIVARNSEGRVVLFSQHSTNDTLERRWRDGSLELDLPVQALSEMFQCNHFLVSQTNPHIVPLLNLKKMLPRNLGKIMEAELKHRCQVLQWMLPDWVPSKWLTLFTQPWEGDITMTLPPELWHLGRTIRNPSINELNCAVKIGERSTWENLSSIESNCTIEATLDACVAKITNAVRTTPLRGLGRSLPSWLHMTSVGLPNCGSWGNNVDIATPSAGNSKSGSEHGGSVSGEYALPPGTNIWSSSAEEELADSATETLPRRRTSGSLSNFMMDAAAAAAPPPTVTLLPLGGVGSGTAAGGGNSPSRGGPAVTTPRAFLGSAGTIAAAAGGSGGSPAVGRHWDMSSDDACCDDGGSGHRGRGRSSAGLRRLSSGLLSVPTLSASLMDLATMDCTDASVGGLAARSANSGIWGALFGVATSSSLAAGVEHGGFGVDLLQY